MLKSLTVMLATVCKDLAAVATVAGETNISTFTLLTQPPHTIHGPISHWRKIVFHRLLWRTGGRKVAHLSLDHAMDAAVDAAWTPQVSEGYSPAVPDHARVPSQHH